MSEQKVKGKSKYESPILVPLRGDGQRVWSLIRLEVQFLGSSHPPVNCAPAVLLSWFCS